MATAAEQRRAEAARIKAENEARKQRVAESRAAAPAPAPTPAPTPAPAPAPTPALTRTEEATFGMTNAQVTQAAALAQAVAQAVVQSPVVIAAPEDTAPKASEVKKITEQVAASVAPIIAPQLPSSAVQDIVSSVVQNVVASPEVKAAPENVPVAPEVTQQIIEAVSAEVVPLQEEVVSAPTAALTRTEEATFGVADTRPTPSPAPVTTAAAAPGTAPVSVTAPAPETDAPTRSYQALQAAIESGTLTYFAPVSPIQSEMAAKAAEAEAARLMSGADIPATADPAKFIEESIAGAAAGAGTGVGTPIVTPAVTAPVTPAVTAPVTPPLPPAPEPEPADAIFKIAMQKLSQYGLKDIADSLKKAREAYPELELADLLFLVENDDRYNAPFKKRFQANELRESKGLPKLTAADYLAMEQGYKKIFATYNLPMFSNQSQYDKLIAGDVDVADLSDRVVMAYDRVITDTSTRNAFRQFYGNLTDADIVSALLDPEQQIPALERKVVAAEVGGQALRQGLAAGLGSMEAMVTPDGRQVTGYTNVRRGTLGADILAGEGVTEQSAAAGYERIAEQLPTAEKLSSIYGGRAEQVGQRELEQAELLGLESAKRKQRRLAGMEEATFSGQAGTMRTSLGRRGKQGAF